MIIPKILFLRKVLNYFLQNQKNSLINTSIKELIIYILNSILEYQIIHLILVDKT